MLVLTRRIGEQIFIDKGQIKIKVLFVRNGNIALGIQAPSQVDVDREEIYYRKQDNPESIAVESN
ncbi:vir region protein [Legionella birminghamensis]|uniref:Translational regulator CsrA n=1 Tax=Legionella birminghamensis TaxID=28083 RepID=A0A378IBM8_9GAMM|nr:carbon storage regulator [Legionella birminghamensis]KTC76184.1 vir region protein [Legionella birminghamensis]STX32192.1 vir region protein [Legionella birminghamensis]